MQGVRLYSNEADRLAAFVKQRSAKPEDAREVIGVGRLEGRIDATQLNLHTKIEGGPREAREEKREDKKSATCTKMGR
jgi:hypothetical protein